MLWPSAPWWTLRRTPRPSSSGTFWLDRRREVFTVRALHTGPFSSQYSSFVFQPLMQSDILYFHLVYSVVLVLIGNVFFPRWSHDGKFFARMTTDTLSIYETPVRSDEFRCNGVLMTLCSKAVPLFFSVHGFAGQEESQNNWDQVSDVYSLWMIVFNVERLSEHSY